MKRGIVIFAIIGLLPIVALLFAYLDTLDRENPPPMAQHTSDQDHAPRSAAPIADRRAHSFSHHGITVQDPYAWLRDPDYPTVDDEDILAYLGAENAHFEDYMAPLASLVEEIFAEIKGRQVEDEESVPYVKDGYAYQWRYVDGAQYRTYFRAAAPAGRTENLDWQVLLDQPAMAAEHDFFRLGALDVSPDGRRLAYSADTTGSERYTLHVIDIETRGSLTTPIEDTIGSPAWGSDSEGLLYTVLSDQWRPYLVRQRVLNGDPEAEDRLVYEEQDSSFFVGLSESQSEEYVFISAGSHTSNEVRYLRADTLDATPVLIAPREPHKEYDVEHRGDEFLILSNLRHTNFDVFRTPISTPGVDNWSLWIEGDERHYLTGLLALADYTIVSTRIDGLDQVRVIPQPGAAGEDHYIDFPEASYDAGLSVNPEFRAASIRLGYTSMVTPNTTWQYDIETETLTTLKVQEIPSGYDPSLFVTTRLLARARDGVQVPVSLVHHRSTPIDGSAPLYLYGYGAYGHAIPPSFSTSRISLLERGFVFAIAHIRGGDDLGYDWYTAGKLEQRSNTFNDFVDVARHLINTDHARPGNIAIAGGSAGGELMGAAVNQAPELWGAVAAHVPFVDVLNTILDDSLPLTPLEWDEWGNPITDEGAFRLIQSYSPYDQLIARDYPPMLVTAGLNDPRVTYWEPAKYVAKLRHLKTDANPLLLKTNMEAGHGGKSGRYDSLREVAEEYAFFVNLLNEG